MYIIIEIFPSIEEAIIVYDPGTFKNRIFDTIEEAEEECKACQNGKIVEI